jgi:hypothetical protein
MVAGREDAYALKGDPHRVTTPTRKDFAMDANLDLITCSLCLRVRRGSEWMDAERVIREIRSYELAAPPRLRSAVCDVCAESIFSGRMQDEPLAA